MDEYAIVNADKYGYGCRPLLLFFMRTIRKVGTGNKQTLMALYIFPVFHVDG